MSAFNLVFLEGNVNKIMATVLIGSGAFVLGLVSFNQLKIVKETKNTSFLDKKFMIFQLFTCFFLGFASVFGLMRGEWTDMGKGAGYKYTDLVLILINAYLFYTNYYTLRTKLNNMAEAQKAGMTEAEYYQKVIAPSIKSKTK